MPTALIQASKSLRTSAILVSPSTFICDGSGQKSKVCLRSFTLLSYANLWAVGA